MWIIIVIICQLPPHSLFKFIYCLLMSNSMYVICPHIDGTVQDCSNSIANALELLPSFTKPSIPLRCLIIFRKSKNIIAFSVISYHKDGMDCWNSSLWKPRIHLSPQSIPENKVHGDNMGPTWVLLAPGGPHVGPINPAWLMSWWLQGARVSAVLLLT